MLCPAGSFGGPLAGSSTSFGNASPVSLVAASVLSPSYLVCDASRSAITFGFASFASSAACACSPCTGELGVTSEALSDEEVPLPSPAGGPSEDEPSPSAATGDTANPATQPTEQTQHTTNSRLTVSRPVAYRAPVKLNDRHC